MRKLINIMGFLVFEKSGNWSKIWRNGSKVWWNQSILKFLKKVETDKKNEETNQKYLESPQKYWEIPWKYFNKINGKRIYNSEKLIKKRWNSSKFEFRGISEKFEEIPETSQKNLLLRGFHIFLVRFRIEAFPCPPKWCGWYLSVCPKWSNSNLIVSFPNPCHRKLNIIKSYLTISCRYRIMCVDYLIALLLCRKD